MISYQKQSVELLEWSCRGDRVGELDARYQQVVEGRDVGVMRTRYSSCADLAHWLWYRLGIRVREINRREHLGWKVGVNVSRIVSLSTPYQPDGALLQGGDVIVITTTGYDAHVICVVDQPDRDTLLTAEYGQPGGCLRQRKIKNGRIGRRQIKYVVKLEALINSAKEQNLLEGAVSWPT